MTEQAQDNLYVVGIGTSAGGLEALEKFFTNMPFSPQFSFVVIQHLSPDYESHMVELLSKYTPMPVHEAKDGIPVAPGSIYLIPRRKNMTIFRGKLLLIDYDRTQGLNLPIDIFFESLGKDQQEKAIGIILSGTGSDGTRGLRTIKEMGGMVMVQNESAKFDGMPNSAIATRLVDYVTSPEKMPEILVNYIKHPGLIIKAEIEGTDGQGDDAELVKLFALLHKNTGVDFTDYKRTTVLRRIERRMSLNQIDHIIDYVTYLKESPNECQILSKEFLIGVTRFFREPEAFEFIQQQVLPTLFKDKETQQSPLRIWVPGCATGEEAYSLAIIIQEYMERVGRYVDVKIFATDLDKEALGHASRGAYSDSITADVSSERLRNFFVKRGNHYEILRRARTMVVFAQHNLVKDPPFSNMDFISCRNLLIYFKQPLQRRALDTFQFALRPGGYLFLGTSETVGSDYDNIFLVEHSKWKIYRMAGGRPSITKINPIRIKQSEAQPEKATGVRDYRTATSTQNDDWRGPESILRSLVEQVMPPCVVVDDSYMLIHAFGEVRDFLKAPVGYQIDLNVLHMTPEELSLPVSTALQRSIQTQEEVMLRDIPVKELSKSNRINLITRPFWSQGSQRRLYLVIFDLTDPKEITEEDPGESFNLSRSASQRIKDLEQELQYTKENLQATIEELETANEELQATNEELLAANEELQSTNEELQSVNEELITVNTEYQAKIKELTLLNDDVNNLLRSTDIGTIFLDSDLCVRKFTPATTAVINLLEYDIGRPLSHITHNLIGVDLVSLSQKVLESATTIERELQSSQNGWYFLKVMPFRTSTNQIDGVLITLVDFTALRRAEYEIEDLDKARVYLNNVGILIMALNPNGDISFISRKGAELLGYRPDDIIGQNWFKTCLPKAEQKQAQAVFQQLMAGGQQNNAVNESYIVDRTGHKKQISWTSSLLKDESGKIVGMLSSGIDITERTQIETALKESEERFRVALKNAPVTVTQQDRELNYRWIYNTNTYYHNTEDVIGKSEFDLLPKEEAQKLIDIKGEVVKSGHSLRREVALTVQDKTVYYDLTVEPLRGNDDEIVGITSAVTDITPYKEAMAAVNQQIKLSEYLLQSMPHFFVAYDQNGRILKMNSHMLDVLGYSSDEVMGQEYIPMFIPQAERSVVAEVMDKTRAGQTKVLATNHVIKKDGEQLLVEWYSWPVHEEPNKIAYYFVLGVDLPKKKNNGPLSSV
ncbi:MAG TPA: chemotaxis protein CheB [Anaerolineae bacterium]|nr:PAS domain S-box protein [Anaerolineales bacterium]HRV91127.1 chemotaxis protein CheB [Anaerolineae bacterium]